MSKLYRKQTTICHDLLSLWISFYQINGPFWEVPLGRRDGRVSLASEILAELPGPVNNITTLKQLFAATGLNTKDVAVLSGNFNFLSVKFVTIYVFIWVRLLILCSFCHIQEDTPSEHLIALGSATVSTISPEKVTQTLQWIQTTLSSWSKNASLET